MGRDLRALTVDRLPDLVEPCRDCQFWELTPAQARSTRELGDPRHPKRGWLTSVLLEWGTPGRILYVDDVPAGFVTYAPAYLVPRSMAFPTAPVSADAALLIAARVAPEYAGQGLGRVLLQSAARDLLRRRIRAVEVFASAREQGSPMDARLVDRPTGVHTRGRRGREQDPAGGRGATVEPLGALESRDGAARTPDAQGRHAPHEPGGDPMGTSGQGLDGAGVPADGRDAGQRRGEGRSRADRSGATRSGNGERIGDGRPAREHGCLLPVDFLTAVGFHTVREHAAYPRLRLDLRTALRWRVEVEHAVERLFTPMRGLGVAPPVGTANRQKIP